MFDDSRRFLTITAGIGAAMALFSTVLPWYSFNVILPVVRVVHVFAVTTTLWGFTTLAPILIVVGAFVAIVATGFLPRPAANGIAVVIALAMLVYAIIRCLDVPNLGVEILPGGIPAITELEGGPFILIGGSLLIFLGALGDLFAPATEPDTELRATRRFRGFGGGPVPPAPVAG